MTTAELNQKDEAGLYVNAPTDASGYLADWIGMGPDGTRYDLRTSDGMAAMLSAYGRINDVANMYSNGVRQDASKLPGDWWSYFPNAAQLQSDFNGQDMYAGTVFYKPGEEGKYYAERLRNIAGTIADAVTTLRADPKYLQINPDPIDPTTGKAPTAEALKAYNDSLAATMDAAPYNAEPAMVTPAIAPVSVIATETALSDAHPAAMTAAGTPTTTAKKSRAVIVAVVVVALLILFH